MYTSRKCTFYINNYAYGDSDKEKSQRWTWHIIKTWADKIMLVRNVVFVNLREHASVSDQASQSGI